MSSILQNRLSRLDAKFQRESVTYKPLRVFYGWAKINKIRKKEAISVIFENDTQPEERTMRSINRMMDVAYVRDQTEDEKKGALGVTRMFTEYSVFLADKRFQGSLALALRHNSEADRRNVSLETRDEIMDKLKSLYLTTHPDYKEPIVQLELDFDYEEID